MWSFLECRCHSSRKSRFATCYVCLLHTNPQLCNKQLVFIPVAPISKNDLATCVSVYEFVVEYEICCKEEPYCHTLSVFLSFCGEDQLGVCIRHDDVIKWKHFCVIGLLWGESTGQRWFLSQRPVTRNFDVFFDVRLNQRLSKQSRRRWFDTLSCSLWRHCNWGDTKWSLQDMSIISRNLYTYKAPDWIFQNICHIV